MLGNGNVSMGRGMGKLVYVVCARVYCEEKRLHMVDDGQSTVNTML